MSGKTKYYFGKYENGEMVTRRGAGTDFLCPTKETLKNSNSQGVHNYETYDLKELKISVFGIELDINKAVQVE